RPRAAATGGRPRPAPRHRIGTGRRAHVARRARRQPTPHHRPVGPHRLAFRAWRGRGRLRFLSRQDLLARGVDRRHRWPVGPVDGIVPPLNLGRTSGAPERALVRAIGVVGLAAGIVNVTIGGGIFRLPADVARALGPAAPLAYLACAVAMGLIVLCFAEAGSRVDLTGGPYAYVETAFGPFVGF